MSLVRSLIVTIVVCSCLACSTATADREPQIGYLFPAGAQQGTTTRIIAGGQYLNRPAAVRVSGKGVQAEVVKYIRPLRNLNREQRYMFLTDLAAATEKELKAAGLGPKAIEKAKNLMLGRWSRYLKQKIKTEGVRPPEHYLLTDLEEQSLRELVHTRQTLFFPRQKKQRNRQLEESVLIEITVAADATPGERELRLQTRTGLTNPVTFQVGQLPETRELEPNDDSATLKLSNMQALNKQPKFKALLTEKPLQLPVTLNGQIMPGDVDRFRFRANKGQKVVMEVSARRLVPYLADAVPGWFQATVALYDQNGEELAFADDYRFKPDPVLLYEIPASGVYELQIRDALYRGREDFVYRVSVGETPFVTQAFPLGGKEGVKTVASVEGWNIPPSEVPLNTDAGGPWIRHAAWNSGSIVSNAFPYAVDTLPEAEEQEPNDPLQKAQPVELPVIINGRVEKPGDGDVFRVKGDAGDTIVAEVYARRLDSPLDSLVRLMDDSGKILEWNDDHVRKEEHLHVDRVGLVTHHADSYLTAKLPKKGAYYVHLSDARKHGSGAHGYRLRISQPRPDFALRATPSSIFTLPGGIVPVTVYALRKDGFDGPINISVKAPAGFKTEGGRIPAGRDTVRMTLRVPRKAPESPVTLRIEGSARIDGQKITRAALGADDTMQAFLYRHLVPADDLMVAVRKVKWGLPAMEIAGPDPIEIPADGSAKVLVKTRDNRLKKNAALALHRAPQGISLHGFRPVAEGVEFRLKADKTARKESFTGNLIVEIFREHTPKGQQTKRRTSIGYLPAIPVKVVQGQKHAAK